MTTANVSSEYQMLKKKKKKEGKKSGLKWSEGFFYVKNVIHDDNDDDVKTWKCVVIENWSALEIYVSFYC